MRSILFVGHGSKVAEGNQEVRNFVDLLRNSLEHPIVETCFLEFEGPSILQGIRTCVEKGATQVYVMPMILLPAGHSKLHIPSAIDQAKKEYPHVQFVYGRPIGIHEQTIGILTSRLEQSGLVVEREDQETAILVVGRGSSDPDANSELCKITRLLWERLKVKWVETAFMGVTDPLLEEGIERCRRLGAQKVIILPYFLFTGVLMHRMEEMIQQFSERYSDQEFILAHYFGYHPILQQIVMDRVEEAIRGNIQMNCDTCQYRVEAMQHHHHDHDHHHDHSHHHNHSHGHE